MESGRTSRGPPYRNVSNRGLASFNQDSLLFKFFFSLTFGIALIFYIISIYVLFSPSNSAFFNEPSPVYFFVLLLNTPVIPVPTFWVALVMVIFYTIFFSAMLYLGIIRRNGSIIDNPVIFYGGIATFAFMVSFAITIIELALGIGVGGSSIDTALQQHPYLMFIQFIYAPFAEELGFRIIPLGLFSVYLVRKASKLGTTRRDAALSFIIPGVVRRKYGISLTGGDYTLVIITSILFGMAHFLSGAWDPGKIISAAFVGLVLAFGFLKFGLFVDIPMHWFFNGLTTLYVVYPPLTDAWAFSLFWLLLSGVVAMLFVYFVYTERKKKTRLSGPPPDSLA